MSGLRLLPILLMLCAPALAAASDPFAGENEDQTDSPLFELSSPGGEESLEDMDDAPLELPPAPEEPGEESSETFLFVPPVEPGDVPLESLEGGEQPSLAPQANDSAEMIDIRPPRLSPLGELQDGAEPRWLDALIDDHLLLRRNVRGDLEMLPRGDSGFGITSLGFKGEVDTGGPYWIAPFFGWHFLSGPRQPGVPAQVYDLGVEFNLAKQINETWGLHVQATPLLSTDFNNKSDDAFRMTGSGMLTFQADSVTRLVAGLIYLDRPDLNFLPIAGLKWLVTENFELDLLVPRPRMAYRVVNDENEKDYLYMAGEVGGGSWAIETSNNVKQRMGYKDLRLLFGFERAYVSGDRSVLEAGYVFDRHLDFTRGGDQRLGGTAVIRWGRLY